MVHSSKNPDRVRGLTRDSDNKNPDIIEWEEVDIDSEPRYIYLEKERTEDQAEGSHSSLAAFSGAVEAIATLTFYLAEHPEIAPLNAAIEGGKKVGHFFSNIGKKVFFAVKGMFAKKNEKQLPEVDVTQRESTKIEELETKVALAESISIDENEREELSIEDARSLVIDILPNYIKMKKSVERLSRAKIHDFDIPKIEMRTVIERMDSVVKRYPTLMDSGTLTSIQDLLKTNADPVENTMIMKALKIPSQ